MSVEYDRRGEQKDVEYSISTLTICSLHFRYEICRMSSALSPVILSDNLVCYSSGSLPISPTELNLRQTLLGGQSFR